MEEATEQSRTSLYLVRKVEALAGVVQFFIKNDGATAERKLQFLAQSDFWDWEMDNLIYSFTNFNERQKTWHSFDQTIDKLGDLGILMGRQDAEACGLAKE